MKWVNVALVALWLVVAALNMADGDVDWIVALGAAAASAHAAIGEFHIADLKREVCDYHERLMSIYRRGDA